MNEVFYKPEKPRQQKINRNIGSNTLKVYFKQLRDPRSETYKNLKKIIAFNKTELTIDAFMNYFNSIFPQSSTYICFDRIKKLSTTFRSNKDREFSKILRVSIKRFFQF